MKFTSIIFFITAFFIIIGCNEKTKPEAIEVDPNIHLSEYQNSDFIFDKNDRKLMIMDTVLSFSSNKLLYKVYLNKSKVKIEMSRWNEMPDNIPTMTWEGFQRNGFIYLKNQSNDFEVSYKLILNKGLLQWNGQNWVLFKVGET